MNIKSLISRKKEKSIREIIGISHMEDDYFIKPDGSIFDFFQLPGMDLLGVSDENIERIVNEFNIFYKTYPGDLKIISINYPTDVSKQKQYVFREMDKDKNPVHKEFLKKELKKIEKISESVTYREYYLMFFAKTKIEYDELKEKINVTLGMNSFASELSADKKIQIVFKLCNKNTALNNAKGFNPKKVKSFSNSDNFLFTIQPQGGCAFHNERYVSTGDGYETCLTIYEYPNQGLNLFWLTSVISMQNTIATVDISTNDINEVLKNINHSMKEYQSRYASARSETEKEANKGNYQKLQEINKNINLGEVAKLITIRIFVTDTSLEDLEKNVSNIIKTLEAKSYRSTTFLNECLFDWKSVFKSYSEQMKTRNKRKGHLMMSDALAGGLPFHCSALHDPNGLLLGNTPTGGAVFLDLFHKDNVRTHYNAVIAGKSGMGKSTLLKLLLRWYAITGNFLRVFDVTGEFESLVKFLGGKVVALDGSDGIINPLEIMEVADNNRENLSYHMSKISTIYQLLSPSAEQYEVAAFEDLLRGLYVQFGVLPEDDDKIEDIKISGLPPQRYPIFSDLLEYINKVIDEVKSAHGVQKEVIVQRMKRIEKIQVIVKNITENYGSVFNGHTSIIDVHNVPIVSFSIKGLAQMKSTVFDAQMYNGLALCWDNCMKIGQPMKALFENGEIDWEDVTRFFIFIDEAHKIVNTNKLTGVHQLTSFSREGRKFFGGLVLATQSVRDMVSESSDSSALEQIKTLFELTQYKIIMQQDNNALSSLRSIFSGQLTEEQIADIPKLRLGDCMLSISGSRNIKLNVKVTEEDKKLFKGGA